MPQAVLLPEIADNISECSDSGSVASLSFVNHEVRQTYQPLMNRYLKEELLKELSEYVAHEKEKPLYKPNPYRSMRKNLALLRGHAFHREVKLRT